MFLSVFSNPGNILSHFNLLKTRLKSQQSDQNMRFWKLWFVLSVLICLSAIYLSSVANFVDIFRPWTSTLHGFFSKPVRNDTEIQRKNYRTDVSYFVDPLDAYPWSPGEETTLYSLPQIEGTKGEGSQSEALNSLSAAADFQTKGKYDKARRLYEHAIAMAPRHPDVLTQYGLFMEKIGKDVVQAETLYAKALAYNPYHQGALDHRQRTQPLVEDIDNRMLRMIDEKRQFFLNIPRTSSVLRRAMREAYFMHVYHTVAIEGNTMSYIQTRSILETHLAVGGKSVIEHNEILGMDAAMRYLNSSLVHRIGSIDMQDIQQIHRRVMGYVDPIQAGVFRTTQVYVGGFTPIPADQILQEMNDFIEWLNAEETLRIHPVELAALAHYKFVYIHPFVDGNGRTSRLLMNLILMQAGFPPVIIRVEDRLQYYETLQAANEGDLRPFIRFIASATERTLDGYLDTVVVGYRNKSNQTSTDKTPEIENDGA